MSHRFVITLPRDARDQAAAFSQRGRDAGADLLELRGDLTPGIRPFESALPLLLAPRGQDLAAQLAQGAAVVDMEPGELAPPCPGALRLGSFHDAQGMPAENELERIAERLVQDGAQALKLVVTPRDWSDVLRLESLRARLARGIDSTLLAMGPLAEWTRLVSPSRNALTYAALDERSKSAPGQWTLARHRALLGTTEPRVTGILGGARFVEHSLSPKIHSLLAARHGIHSAYLRFPSAQAALDLAALHALGVHGLSVTAPHKQAAAGLARIDDPAASQAGAVNTLVRLDAAGEPDWSGYQLDLLGLVRGYRDWRGARSTAVLGSGGAAAAVLLAARELDWNEVTLFARSLGPAQQLAERFGCRAEPLERLPHTSVDLIVSTLPVDLDPALLPRPRGPRPRALDLRYGSPSAFLESARSAGFEGQDGLSMLIHQALAQFERFHGVRCTEDDLQAVKAKLAIPRA